MKRVLGLSIALLFAACGSHLKGTYSDPMGAMQYTFESGGTVYVSVMGMEQELQYEVDGQRVRIISPLGNQILMLQDDGSLQGPLGLTLTKRE
jgi:hypothetical protein